MPGMGEARMFGRFLEEFEVGDVYRHWPGKTITEYDDHLFCAITWNHHPLHTNAHYAETQTEFERNVVVGNLVYSLALGMSVPDVSGKAIANLEVESLKHPAPMFHGDTLYAETTVLSPSRRSSSRPPPSSHSRELTKRPSPMPPCVRRVLMSFCTNGSKSLGSGSKSPESTTRTTPSRPSRSARTRTGPRPWVNAFATSSPITRARWLGRTPGHGSEPTSISSGRPGVSRSAASTASAGTATSSGPGGSWPISYRPRTTCSRSAVRTSAASTSSRTCGSTSRRSTN